MTPTERNDRTRKQLNHIAIVQSRLPPGEQRRAVFDCWLKLDVLAYRYYETTVTGVRR